MVEKYFCPRQKTNFRVNSLEILTILVSNIDKVPLHFDDRGGRFSFAVESVTRFNIFDTDYLRSGNSINYFYNFGRQRIMSHTLRYTIQSKLDFL